MTPPGVDVARDLTERLSRDLDGTFAEVVAAYQGVVYTTALRLSGQAADAEDLAAETFLQAYRSLRGWSPQRIVELQPRPWFVTIALNLWRNRARSASRRPREVELRHDSLPPATGASPEQQAQDLDERGRLAARLAELSEGERVAVVLRHVVGLPYQDVADVLGCPLGTAKSHVSRGLARLRAATTGPAAADGNRPALTQEVLP